MAERIEKLPEPRRPNRSQRPWDEWLDGTVWRAKRDVDFRGGVDSFAAAVRAAARKRGLDVRVIRESPETVAWQVQGRVAKAGPTKGRGRARGTGTAWSAPEIQRVLDAWIAGDTTAEIGAAHQRTESAIVGIISRLRAHGVEVPRRHSGRASSQSRRWHDPIPTERVVLTEAQVEAIFGSFRRGSRRVQALVWTRDDLQRLADEWHEGAALHVIAESLGRSRSSVTNRITAMRDAGISMPARTRRGDWRDDEPHGPAPTITDADHQRIDEAMRGVRIGRRNT